MSELIRNKSTGILEVWENGKKAGPILTMEDAMAAAGEEGKHYEVIDLDEECADLRCLDSGLNETKMVSRYYLPSEITVGTRLKCENLIYVIA